MRIVLLTAFACLCFTSLQASLSTDSIQVVALQDSALNLLRNNEIDKANATLAEALQSARELDNLLLYLAGIKNFASHWRDKTSTPEQAIPVYQKGLLDSLWRSPQVSDEWLSLGWLYTQMGATYEKRLGKFTAAKDHYEQADAIFANGQCTPHLTYVARFVYRPLGNIYTRFGDYSGSSTKIQQFIRVMLDSNQIRKAAEGYSDLGILYENWNKPAQAEEAYRLGMALPDDNRISQSLLAINYGWLLHKEDRKSEAIDQLLHAEDLLNAELQEERPDRRTLLLMGACLEKQAAVHEEAERYEQAVSLLDQTLAVYTDYFGETKRREFAKTFIQYGNLRLAQGSPDQAISAYQQAIGQLIEPYTPKSSLDLPDASSFYAENALIETLVGMAKAYHQWYDDGQDLAMLEKALHCHELIFSVEQELRRSYLYESSKLFTMEESRERSEQAIELALELFEKTGQQAHQWAAFVFAERSRGTLLREAFRSAQATDLGGITAEQRAEEATLQYAVNQAEEALFDYRSGEAADSLIQQAEQDLLQAREALNRWIRELEALNPRYFQLKYNDQVPSLADIQSILLNGQVMVEYFLGEEMLYTFIISEQGLYILTGQRPDQLMERVLAFRRSIEGYQYPDANRSELEANYQMHGLGLYQDLLAAVVPHLRSADQLLIIPSGILDLLPFEALLTQQVTGKSDFRQYPYLLRDYVVSYGYSAGLQWGLHQLPRGGQGWVGFAPTFDGSAGWGRLSCSQDLLSQLQEQWDGNAFMANNATRAAFVKQVERYRMLHLATHAQSNPDAGEFSFIVFSDGAGGYDSLFTKDLYLLDLEAELVMLSACETALGTLYESEGVISLARGFHYAGARSVLTTLWSINEGANCHLMESFYTYLKEGLTKSEALQAAKLAYLDMADVRSSHPVYWAGFQLLGNPRPLEDQAFSYWWLASLLLLPIGYFFYQRRQKEFRSARSALASA